jgi:hypothetical protein
VLKSVQLHYVPIFCCAFVLAMLAVGQNFGHELLCSAAVHALSHDLIGKLVGTLQFLDGVAGNSLTDLRKT